ncbi:aminoacetone oxidase family FAD-binding enzyme [Clostridia bacterium]|nr:aminoacetone oxidase family FAD-binding enzyme [Clostridia bacterium]
MTKYDCIVIGGGAAGIFAAITLKRTRPRLNIAVIEKSRPLHKLTLTGKGRCNLTTAKDPVGGLVRNRKFMMSAFAAFTCADTVDFFASIGVPAVTERGSRVFPESQKATDVAAALLREVKSLGVDIIAKSATALLTADTDGGVRISGVACGSTVLPCTAVILACGGASYPATGSDGGGFRLAEAAGHTVTPALPSLVPLVTRESVDGLAGLTLKNVRLRFDKPVARLIGKDCPGMNTDTGEIIFTDDGIGGALAISVSAFITELLHADGGGAGYSGGGVGNGGNGGAGSDSTVSGDDNTGIAVHLDFKPALTETQLRERIGREITAMPPASAVSLLLRRLLPAKIVEYFLIRANIAADTPLARITEAHIRGIVTHLKNFGFTIVGTKPIAEAICTRGGVSVREINPKTMESKQVRGLYFAGEIIDVDGLTGGYNLQIAWSTAYAAACGIAGL